MNKIYEHNYITNFIIRLDFEKKLEEDNFESLFKVLKKDYNITEKYDIHNANVVFNEKDASEKPSIDETEVIRNYIFYNENKKERFTLNKESIIFEALCGVEYEKVKKYIKKLVSILTKEYDVKNYIRIGIRYVNAIKTEFKDKKDILKWEGYINPNLMPPKKIFDNQVLLQHMQTFDFKMDTENHLGCRLQVGIPNHELPKGLKEKVYLIDIDVFSYRKVNADKAIDILDAIHEQDIELFEMCIDNKLRKEMQ